MLGNPFCGTFHASVKLWIYKREYNRNPTGTVSLELSLTAKIDKTLTAFPGLLTFCFVGEIYMKFTYADYMVFAERS